jgi:hypothetical protein
MITNKFCEEAPIANPQYSRLTCVKVAGASALILCALLVSASPARGAMASALVEGQANGGNPALSYHSESSTDSLHGEAQNSFASSSAIAAGGYIPYVSASASSFWPEPAGSGYGTAYARGRVTWSFTILPGSQSTDPYALVDMDYTARLTISSGGQSWQRESVVGYINTLASPVQNANGWRYVSGGGYQLDFSAGASSMSSVYGNYDEADGVYAYTGTPTFQVPYNSPVTFTIDASAFAIWGGENASIMIDPRMYLSADWLAAHPGDTIEFQTLAAPVPEPSTYVAGALLLLPFGASALRSLRKNRSA